MLRLINPVRRAEPFDHADWVFEAKFDGFRAAADTVVAGWSRVTATACSGSSTSWGLRCRAPADRDRPAPRR